MLRVTIKLPGYLLTSLPGWTLEVTVMLFKNIRCVALFAILLFVLSTIRVNAQGIPNGSATTDTGMGGVNAITGTVIVSNGQRIERRITVRLQSMLAGDRVTTTDEYGNFKLNGLPSGDYTIVINKEKDFEPFTQVVTIIQPRGMPPQTYFVSLRLKPKAGTDAPPAVINTEFVNVPKAAMEYLKKAGELSKVDDHKGAIEQLELAIKEYPQFAYAYSEIGDQYVSLHDYEKADAAYVESLKIKPDAYGPMLNHGIILYNQKKYGEAEPVFRIAIALKEKSQSAPAHYFRGQSLAYLGKFDEAEKELNLALSLGGDAMADSLKEAHRLLAIIYSTRGDKKRQVDELETYLRLAPKAQDAEQLKALVQRLKTQ